MTCVPTLNVTRDGTAPAAGGVKVARKVSMSLYCGVSTETESPSVPVALFTVCADASEVDGAKSPDGRYAAVTECVPAPSALDASVAAPPLSATLPSDVEPSKNSTAPVGVPAALVTVAAIAVCP